MRPPLDMGIMICKPISRSQFFLQLTRVETIENPSRFRVNNQIVQSECRQSIAKVQSNRAFSFSFSIPLCGLGVCTAAKCCVNLVFKGSVSLRESSDLDGSFHSLFL